MVELGSETFRGKLGHKGGAMLNGIRALEEEARECLAVFLPWEDTAR